MIGDCHPTLPTPVPRSFENNINKLRLLDWPQLPLSQLHLQRALLPDDDNPALVVPVLLTRRELIVEAEKEPRDGDPQLRVRQVLAQAVPGAEAEGVFCFGSELASEQRMWSTGQKSTATYGKPPCCHWQIRDRTARESRGATALVAWRLGRGSYQGCGGWRTGRLWWRSIMVKITVSDWGFWQLRKGTWEHFSAERAQQLTPLGI